MLIHKFDKNFLKRIHSVVILKSCGSENVIDSQIRASANFEKLKVFVVLSFLPALAIILFFARSPSMVFRAFPIKRPGRQFGPCTQKPTRNGGENSLTRIKWVKWISKFVTFFLQQKSFLIEIDGRRQFWKKRINWFLYFFQLYTSEPLIADV